MEEPKVKDLLEDDIATMASASWKCQSSGKASSNPDVHVESILSGSSLYLSPTAEESFPVPVNDTETQMTSKINFICDVILFVIIKQYT
jgi:hypothetical protein